LKNIPSFKDLVDKYDYFLFDQWGVLHNGKKKFKKAEECLKLLKERNKKVVLISNSSLPSKFSISNLKRIGISGGIGSGKTFVSSIFKENNIKYSIRT